MRYPTPFQQKTLWNAATGVSILVLGALLVGLIWLLGYVFGFLQPVLIPLIVAGIVAYVLDPVVVCGREERKSFKAPRPRKMPGKTAATNNVAMTSIPRKSVITDHIRLIPRFSRNTTTGSNT